MTSSTRPSSLTVFRLLVRAALLLWAGFWAWFVIAASIGELPHPPWWIPAAWLASLAVLVGLAWKLPRLGGLALVAAALGAAVLFPSAGARELLCLPAIALGIGSFALGSRDRRVACAPLLLLLLGLSGCLAPQRVEDRPYRTSSILRHENGGMKRAFLLEQTELDGLPCRDWVWWYEDGRLDNVELACPFEVQGHDFPAETRIFFDREGKLAHAWLSADTTIDGLPCRGRWKIDTAFHPNGHVKAFFPPDTFLVDGVPCAASVFAPIYLHPDGHLQECRLAADATVLGVARRRGETVKLPPRR